MGGKRFCLYDAAAIVGEERLLLHQGVTLLSMLPSSNKKGDRVLACAPLAATCRQINKSDAPHLPPLLVLTGPRHLLR